MDLTLAIEAPSSPSFSLSASDRGSARRAFAAVALVAGGIWATRGAWDHIIYVALRDEEASHVWLVPFLAIWLAWGRRQAIRAVMPAFSIVGPLLVGAGWWIAHAGFYAPRESPWHFGSLLVLIGCGLTVLGTRVLWTVWPAVLVLVFIIPVPGMARQQISIPLERATAASTSAILGAAGVPVTRSGNVIAINGKDVTVAEACNGLRMIFPLFLIVYVFCFLLPLKTWLRVTLLLTSPLSAVGCNVLRLVPTVLLYGYASKSAADTFHTYSGWPMVLIAFMVLMGGVSLLRWIGIPVMQTADQPLVTRASRPCGSIPNTIAPITCCALLAAMSFTDKLRIDPHVADAFHARAAAAVAAARDAGMPKEFPAGQGWWYAGKDVPLDADADGLLKPNAYLHRLYSNPVTGQRAELMLVQCRDARDMQGHYPPVCYPSHGCRMALPGDVGEWKAGPLGRETVFQGREYDVTFPGGRHRIIRNFFVLPDGRIARDMDAVNAAAKNFRELVFGVAQVQILFDAGVEAPERETIFVELIGPNLGLIEVLRSGVPGNAPRPVR